MKLPEPSGRYRPIHRASPLTPAKTGAFLLLGLIASIAVDARRVSAEQESPLVIERGSTPMPKPTPIAAPRGEDEFALRDGAERLVRRADDVTDIVKAMPGPDLHPGAVPPQPEPHYANPYEEILGRLAHAKQLVDDIRMILVAMPAPMTVPGPTPVPAPATAIPPPAAPKPEPEHAAPIPHEQAAPAARTIQEAARDAFTPITAARIAALIVGSLIALALIKCLPRFFRKKHYDAQEVKQLPPKDIEAPPLQDQALELADVMASMGLTDGAAHALVERIRANPRQALSHWLKLLDVYRKAGRREDFETAAAEVKNNFNVRPGNWNPRTEDREASSASIENYPHIVTQLKKLWPKPTCSDYLLNLLADNRDGKRAGFPLPVVEEIVMLLAVLRDEEARGESDRIVDVDELAREPEPAH